MGGLKLIGYLLVAVLLFSALLMPLMEMLFVYRERLTLSDSLYNSCRVAAEAGYRYVDARKTNAVLNKELFRQAFEDAFASSFDLYVSATTATAAGYSFKFKPYNTDAYNEFKVELEFPAVYDTLSKKWTVKVIAQATSAYKFKHNYILKMINEGSGINYQLKSTREYPLEVIN